MFRSIDTLPAGSYFRSECGRGGQVIEDMHGYVKVLYTDRDGKQQRSEWAPATQVIPLAKPYQPSVQATAPDKGGDVATAAPKQHKKQTLLGKPLSAVLRWMGKQGWDLPRVKKALARHGLNASDATIRSMLRAGSKGRLWYGPIPTLSKAEARQLTGGK